MTKIKITVMRALTYEDVFGDDVPEYFPPSIPSPCGKHESGEVFITEGTDCPEGLCNWAYSDIQKEIVHIYHGGDNHWMEEPGVGYASCTDGMKPVLFRIERVED
jgi:uncharacterized repeat protein (TIGR04076 family)